MVFFAVVVAELRRLAAAEAAATAADILLTTREVDVFLRYALGDKNEREEFLVAAFEKLRV